MAEDEVMEQTNEQLGWELVEGFRTRKGGLVHLYFNDKEWKVQAGPWTAIAAHLLHSYRWGDII